MTLLSLILAIALTAALGSAARALAPSPLAQQGPKLVGGGESGNGSFGRDVALSSDGATALVGAPNEDGRVGAAWVFTRSGTTWTRQTELTGGEEEVGEGEFGRSVALSADGDTAVIGASAANAGVGAVWVFTRSGTTWTQQAQLTGAGESGAGHFGTAVALSSDGDTLAIGAATDHDNLGAVWVFTRSGATWTPQGPKLTAGEESGGAELGRDVALSSDGETALAGGPTDDGGDGAVWVFTRSGSAWMQQGPKLTGGAEEIEGAHFGRGVALSADGATALVGGRDDNGKLGAAWVFTRSSSTWAQQGPKLTATSGEVGIGEFGSSVALAADGDTALIGGLRDHGYAGAVWLFTRSGSTWAQQGEKLTGGEEGGKGWFGSGVALSADATTALVGGLGDSGRAGAAWVFGPPVPSPEPIQGGVTPFGVQSNPSAGSGLGDGQSAQQGVGAFKAVGGGVLLLGRTIRVSNGRARVKLRCVAPVACHGRLTLTVTVEARAAKGWKRSTIATARFSIRHGRTVTVRLVLNARGRLDLMAGGGHLRARLAIHVSAPGRVTRTYRVRLVRRRTPR